MLTAEREQTEQLPEIVMPACPVQKILKGQKALVTGANSGIGKGIAIALAHAGADVVVNYYAGEEATQAVIDEAGHCSGRFYGHRADVSQEDQVREMFERMFDEFGTIDILVNNAGIQIDAKFEEMTLESKTGGNKKRRLGAACRRGGSLRCLWQRSGAVRSIGAGARFSVKLFRPARRS